MSVQSMPVVTVCDGIVTTLSTDVANFFEKRHNNVIRDIENIISTLSPDRLLNFEQTEVVRESPVQKGSFIKSKAYRLTRDGFTFLAMGFTGAKAQAFKWAYIDAFNKMEAQLRNSTAEQSSEVPTLTPAQQLLVRQAVASRAKTESKHYHTIYRAIYNRFQIARYDQLPQTELNECLKFINSVNLDVPEMYQENVIKRDPSRKDLLMLTTKDCDGLINVIYCHRYLFRREMEVFHEFLRLVKSPMAGRFFEYMRDPSLMTLEWILERAGYKVEKLDCYQHLISNK